jgi:pyrroloquinoline-quinone synthase
MTLFDPTLTIAAALADRRLLQHPFYRRWERGEVSVSELAAYAAQYRHFEAYLPRFLTDLTAALPDGAAKTLVAANLADEMGDPVPHLELFERFAAAVGAGHQSRSAATANLLGTYDELLADGPLTALAGFVAYESQASDIARTKAEGLRRHHGLNDHEVSFWQHHAEVDEQHAAWACSALGELNSMPERTGRAVRRAADAWWAFLDEREAAALVS